MEHEAMIDDLRSMLGPDHVVVDPDRLTTHTLDWTGRWQGSTPAVLFPATTEEVAEVVGWCQAHGVAVVPQGGNTGMVGGGVPLGGQLVISLKRLRSLQVDALAGTALVGAGVTLAELQAAAEGAGWMYGVDLGARETATVGGTVATNAGGLHVIRYGDTRHQILGVEAVTGQGQVVGDLRGLVKDNTGYHLPSLLAGSEGTLAVVTRVVVRLHPRPAETAVALLAFEHESTALEAVGDLRHAVADLQALEVFFDDGLQLVTSTFDLPQPFGNRHAAYLLVEAAGAPGVLDRLGTALAAFDELVADVAVAATQGQAQALWRLREAHAEAIGLVGVPHKLDVTVPLTEVADFVTRVRDVVKGYAPAAKTWLFGHAADGNLHVNVTGADPHDTRLDDLVLELTAEVGGSISAEHGIGRAKAKHLHLNRSPSEVALYQRMKQAFDPEGILNPGVLLV